MSVDCLNNNINVKDARLGYVDIAKALAMVLLFINHVGNWKGWGNDVWGYWQCKVWICSFHMELFFFLHGITSKREIYDIRSFKGYMRNIIPQFVIPYFVWGMIYSNSLGIKFWACMLYGSNVIICKVSNGVLWFIPTFVSSSVICAYVKGIHHKFKNRKLVEILEIFLFIVFFLMVRNSIPFFGLPFGLHVSLIAVPMMLLGDLSQKFLREVHSRLNKPLKAFIGLLLCLFGGVISQYNISMAAGTVVTAYADIGNIWLYYVTALIGIAGILLVSMALEGGGKVSQMDGTGNVGLYGRALYLATDIA